jgi:molecular chaperone GrpE (heat shock protein)
MERHQVSEINCKIGDMFDYNIHNGVETIETENEEENNQICAILQKGYKIGDKVLRPVSVKVYSYASEEVKENIEQENNFEAKSENSEEDKGE